MQYQCLGIDVCVGVCDVPLALSQPCSVTGVPPMPTARCWSPDRAAVWRTPAAVRRVSSLPLSPSAVSDGRETGTSASRQLFARPAEVSEGRQYSAQTLNRTGDAVKNITKRTGYDVLDAFCLDIKRWFYLLSPYSDIHKHKKRKIELERWSSECCVFKSDACNLHIRHWFCLMTLKSEDTVSTSNHIPITHGNL